MEYGGLCETPLSPLGIPTNMRLRVGGGPQSRLGKRRKVREEDNNPYVLYEFDY